MLKKVSLLVALAVLMFPLAATSLFAADSQMANCGNRMGCYNGWPPKNTM